MKRLIFAVLLMVASISADAQKTSYLGRLNEEYASGIIRSSDGYLLDAGGDYSANSYRSVFQYLTGKVPGLTIVDYGYNLPFVKYRGGYPAFFVDEIRVDASVVASINMNDVALIKIFHPPFVAAVGGGANGAVAVYTKNGCEEEEAEDSGR